MSKTKFTLLYVDDEPSNLSIFRNTFRRDYKIYTALTPHEGLEILRREKIDLVLSDQRMPEMSGVEFLKRAIDLQPQPNRILVTAYTDFDALREAVNEAKIFQYIHKPWNVESLKHTIENAIQVYDLRQHNVELTEELSEKNKQLIAINEQLKESDRLKYDFLHIISHELRTPLNGMKGAVELMELDHEVTQELGPLLDMAKDSALRLEQFLLLAERIIALRANTYTLRINPIHLDTIVDTIRAEYAPKMQAAKQSLQYNSSIDEDFQADDELLGICLRQVIDNAIKFSKQAGTIHLDASLKDQVLTLNIRDEGRGFSEHILKHIFEVFVTENTDYDSNLGLNLSLVKLIVEMHGGKVSACNHHSGGAQVTLSFHDQKPR